MAHVCMSRSLKKAVSGYLPVLSLPQDTSAFVRYIGEVINDTGKQFFFIYVLESEIQLSDCIITIRTSRLSVTSLLKRVNACLIVLEGLVARATITSKMEHALSDEIISEIVSDQKGYIRITDSGPMKLRQFVTEALILQCDSTLSASKLKHLSSATYENSLFCQHYKRRWEVNIPQPQMEMFVKRLPENAIVVDLGCGPGHHTNYMVRLGNYCVGLDKSMRMLRIAKKEYPYTNFVNANICTTGFLSNVFDGVWVCASLIHTPISFWPPYLEEVKRISKPNAIGCLTIGIGKFPHIEIDGRFFDFVASENSAISLLESLGFLVLEIFGSDNEQTTFGHGRHGKWISVYCSIQKKV